MANTTPSPEDRSFALPHLLSLILLSASILLTGCANGASQSDILTAQTLPPEWTSTPSPTEALGAPTFTPTVESTERAAHTLDPRLVPTAPPGMSSDQVNSAMEAYYSGDYDAAVRIWTGIIEQSPESPLGYYWRASAYTHGAAPVGPQEAYASSAHAALEDIDRAIALAESPHADALLLRSEILGTIANLQTYRAERELVWDASTQDLWNAIRLGTSDPTAHRLYAIDLIHSGNCSRGYDMATRNLQSIGPEDSPSAGNNMILAFASACLGRKQEAKRYISSAMSISPTHQTAYFQALYLYALGDVSNGMAVLNRSIEQSPSLDGYRYYLRALVNFDNGDLALAEEDLFAGQMNTWECAGVASLVRGLLAKRRGERDLAIQEFQLAEATISRFEMPMLQRTRKELASVGARPLDIEPEPSIAAKPILPAQPSDPQVGLATTPAAMPATYESGTGPTVILPLGHQTYRFTPSSPAQITRTYWLRIEVEPTESDPPQDLNIFLWKPGDTVWVMYDFQNGVLDIPDPSRFMTPDGEVFLSAYHNAHALTKLKGIRMSAAVLLADGSYKVLGEDPGEGPIDYFHGTPVPHLSGNVTPLPPSLDEPSLPRDYIYAVDADAPTAPFVLEAEKSVTFQFQWDEPLPKEWIEVTIHVLPPEGVSRQAPAFMIDALTADGGHLIENEPIWGGNILPNLSLPPHAKQSLVINLSNWGKSQILIGGVAVTIRARLPDGTEEVFGWRGAP